MAKETKAGKVITDEGMRGARDAFHVAALVVTCEDIVNAGMSVRFKDGDTPTVEHCRFEDREAIADPFLVSTVLPGQMFWALPLPELVSTLTHTFKLERYAPNVHEPEDDWSSSDDCDWSSC